MERINFNRPPWNRVLWRLHNFMTLVLLLAMVLPAQASYAASPASSVAGVTAVNLAQVSTPISEGVYTLKALHSNKCLEVSGSSTLTGANVQQWSCVANAKQQQWEFVSTGDGYFKLFNVNSHKVLDVAGVSTSDSANIWQWDDVNTANQKWKPVLQADGSYQLVAAHSNKCVDIYGGYTFNGANATQYSCHGGPNQRFQLDQVLVGLETLKGVSIPEDSNLYNFVADKNAAKVLGKALFWDTAVGSDGQTACASCHFHAGADARIKNQLNPTINHQEGAPKNSTYNPTHSGNAGGANYRLNSADFPFFQLADPNDRDSQIVFQTDDVMSSQGVYSTRYVDTTPGNSTDQCELVFDGRFHIGDLSTRRVEPRNTPTMINAVFNLRNFWDGRANETFNGVNPFGPRDKDAGIYRLDTSWFLLWSTTRINKVQPNLYFSSLASQAVGPPLSDFEMSCAQRMWPNVGRRLLSRKPLQDQQVASNDSLLGSYRAPNGMGLNQTYQQLIDKAFKPEYRNNGWWVSLGGVNYQMTEANFSFFFGLAVQIYESTLVSDDAPLDRYFSYGDSSALTDQEKRGMKIFSGKGKCTSCHSGPQLTNAGTPSIEDFKKGAVVSHMILGDGQRAIYDEGFYNIGVRPTIEDIGVGATDPFGNPLSFSAQYKAKLKTGKSFVDPRLTVSPCTFEVSPCSTPSSSVRTAVDGSFKVPTLRNVELTGPYFHNGGRSTLEQVVEFYNRGGDRRGSSSNNSSGFGSNPSNLDADIKPLGLSESEKADLVSFLKRPLTDNRVRCEQAPFDHPQIAVPNGHTGNTTTVYTDGTGRALNDWFTIPAVGANGICASDLSGRLLSFEEILAADGISVNGRDSSPGYIPDFVSSVPANSDSPMMEAPAMTDVPVESITIPDAAPLMLVESVEAVQLDENGNEIPQDPAATGERVYLPLISR